MTSNKIYSFQLLSMRPRLFHAVSTRNYGSMKVNGKNNLSNIKLFLNTLGIPNPRIFLTEQVHGNKIVKVKKFQSGSYFKGADGMISQNSGQLLGILSADCLPILLYDGSKNIVAAIHAGYKGILKNIIGRAVQKFKLLGGDVGNIVSCIGPGIGVCCYNVPAYRINMFKKAFPLYENWHRVNKNKYFLDLKKIAYQNLIGLGVKYSNIEISDLCTFDHSESLYSYRKEGNNSGRFISIIGIL